MLWVGHSRLLRASRRFASRREQCRRVRHALTRISEQPSLPDGANHRADGEAPETRRLPRIGLPLFPASKPGWMNLSKNGPLLVKSNVRRASRVRHVNIPKRWRVGRQSERRGSPGSSARIQAVRSLSPSPLGRIAERQTIRAPPHPRAGNLARGLRLGLGRWKEPPDGPSASLDCYIISGHYLKSPPPI
jgi:hypothetical protein